MLLVEDHSELIDLEVATLMPGFVDAHGRFPDRGERLFQQTSIAPDWDYFVD